VSQHVGKCHDCGGSVLWAKTVRGKMVPLNPTPISVVTGDPSDDETPVMIRSAYDIHIRTCPKRDPRRVRR